MVKQKQIRKLEILYYLLATETQYLERKENMIYEVKGSALVYEYTFPF